MNKDFSKEHFAKANKRSLGYAWQTTVGCGWSRKINIWSKRQAQRPLGAERRGEGNGVSWNHAIQPNTIAVCNRNSV